jgi:hypothetical protein
MRSRFYGSEDESLILRKELSLKVSANLKFEAFAMV